MKFLWAALYLAISAEPSFAAGDCVLDRCADQAPGADQAPAQESSHGASSSYDSPRNDAPSYNARRGGGASAGRFDFYVLALSWSPSFCAGGGATRSRAQCASGANPGFVVHGLWPQYAYGYPSRCRGNDFLPYSILSGLNGLYPDEGLARHEWRQHGLCSGKPPLSYFADVRAARDSVTIPQALKAPRDDKTLSPLDVQRAFLDANPRLRPGMMAVTCRRGVLQEARICLSRDLRDFVACPQVARQSCASQDLFVPAGR
jgi:ribonuclease T2